MTTTQVVGTTWKRGVEDRYPSTNDASLSYGAYAKATDGDIVSGMVAGIRSGTGNEALPAGATAAKTNGFHGVFFSEVSSDLDESAGGAPPTVITGPALLFIRKRALVSNQAYTAGDYLTFGVQASSIQGRIVPEGATGAVAASGLLNRVGQVQEVQADGILMRLNPPTV